MRKAFAMVFAVTAGIIIFSGSVFAHCDTMNGPVITAAQKALESGNVNLVLIWVGPKSENQIREAFKKAQKDRKAGAEEAKKADMVFYETLVKNHREGEGVEYTGIKDAAEVEPGIAAADKAVESGSIEELEAHAIEAVKNGLKNKFREVEENKKYGKNDVKAGRKYVAAYVEFIHYVEGLLAAAEKGGHHEKKAEAQGHQH